MTKYLLESSNQLYTVTGGALVAVTGSVNAATFQAHGFDDVTDAEAVIASLPAVTLYAWNDTQLVSTSASIEGVPGPQSIESTLVNVTASEITSVDEITATYTGNPLCAVSIDGNAYIMYNVNNDTWETAPAGGGMSIADAQSISGATWEALLTGASTFRLRLVLTDENDSITDFNIVFVTM